MYRQSLPLFLTLCLLAACDKPIQAPSTSPSGAASASAPAAASPPVARAWLGKWTGPEGTYLEVLEDGQKYRVSIRNLDGARTFDAVSTDGGLAFERDGTKETIQPGSGKDTGMKWLQDKSDCLVVKAGEGYCRR